MWVIKPAGADRYLTERGSRLLYTVRLSAARKFPTAVEANKVVIPGVEIVKDVTHLLHHLRCGL